MSELLTKTHVLESAKNGQLLQKTTVSQCKLLRNDKVEKANNLRKPEIKKTCTTALLVSLLATCTSPSYAIASHYQPLNNYSFILVDMVAVSGNNGYQELRNLFKHVQHHTIVDVFLCLPFISLPVMGELRLAIALIALWWGGRGNKPFTRRILCAVCLTVSNLPTALYLGQIIKKSLPFEKVQTK